MSKLIFSFKETHVDIAVTSKNFNSIKIKQVVSFTPKERYEDGSIQYDNLDNITQLKRILRRNKIRQKKINAVVSFEGIITRLIEVPFMKKGELRKFIDNNIHEYFTVNLEDYYFDYKIINIEKEEKKKKFIVLLVALPQNRIRDIVGFIKTSGLSLQGINIYPDSIARLFSADDEKSIAIFDVGRTKSNVTILEKGRIFLYSIISHEINDEEDFDDLLENFEYFLNFYSTRHFGTRVDSICLTGELYDNEELKSRIEEQFEIDVDKGLNEAGIKAKANEDIEVNRYVDILGLNVREIIFYGKGADFREVIEGKKYDRGKVILTSVGIASLLITILWPLFTLLYINYSMKKFDLTEINKSIQELSYVEKTVQELNVEKDKFQDKVAFYEQIKNDELNYNAVFDTIRKGLPRITSIKSLTLDKENVNVSFNIENNTLDVPRIVVAINKMGIFEILQIKEVKLDDTVTEASFALKVKKP